MTTKAFKKNFTAAIEFRSKFKKLLPEDIKSSDILDAFQRFCALQPNEAINLLWCLTYSENSAEIAFNIIGLSFQYIPIIELRNELRHHYNNFHPGFLTIEATSQEVQEAYNTLKKKTDLIVSHIVYKHCNLRMFLVETEINRIIYLLNSDKENYFFGGIKALGFSSEEATFLKNSHKEISNLFKAMYDANQQDSKNLPFLEAKQLVITATTDSLVENQTENSTKNESEVSDSAENLPVGDSHYKPITAEEILANKDIFTSFAKNNFEALSLLQSTGFDLNQVMSKKVQISNFIDAVEALK